MARRLFKYPSGTSTYENLYGLTPVSSFIPEEYVNIEPYCRNCESYNEEAKTCVNSQIKVFCDGEFSPPRGFVCQNHFFKEKVQIDIKEEFHEDIVKFANTNELAKEIIETYVEKKETKERTFSRLLLVTLDIINENKKKFKELEKIIQQLEQMRQENKLTIKEEVASLDNLNKWAQKFVENIDEEFIKETEEISDKVINSVVNEVKYKSCASCKYLINSPFNKEKFCFFNSEKVIIHINLNFCKKWKAKDNSGPSCNDCKHLKFYKSAFDWFSKVYKCIKSDEAILAADLDSKYCLDHEYEQSCKNCQNIRFLEKDIKCNNCIHLSELNQCLKKKDIELERKNLEQFCCSSFVAIRGFCTETHNYVALNKKNCEQFSIRNICKNCVHLKYNGEGIEHCFQGTKWTPNEKFKKNNGCTDFKSIVYEAKNQPKIWPRS